MMLYKNTKVKVFSPDGDTDYFDMVTGMLLGDALAPYLFTICLDYGLRMSIDLQKGLKLAKERSRRYPTQTITDADYADDIALLANTPAWAESLLHSLVRVAAGIGLNINAHKTKCMSFIQRDDISKLKGALLKLGDKFIYLGSSVSLTKNDINTQMAKAWTAINRLSILLYGCTTWMLTKRMEKKLDGNYARMLWAELNNSRKQHPTKEQLYGHLPPITKIIEVRRIRNAGHWWRTKDKLISDVLLWTPSHERANVGRSVRTYIQQLCNDSGCSLEDLPIETGGERGSERTVLAVRHDDDDLLNRITNG